MKYATQKTLVCLCWGKFEPNARYAARVNCSRIDLRKMGVELGNKRVSSGLSSLPYDIDLGTSYSMHSLPLLICSG